MPRRSFLNLAEAQGLLHGFYMNSAKFRITLIWGDFIVIADIFFISDEINFAFFKLKLSKFRHVLELRLKMEHIFSDM